ncbi:MAG: SIR2 family protein [Burkholderiales bacterium]|nr:SIR2 family protein [Burkholderiales bacterium]
MNNNEFIYIEEFFKTTLPTLQNNPNGDKTVVFIGAGLSRNYGCSGWSELAQEAIKECYKIPNGINYLTYQDLISTINNPKTMLTIGKRYLYKKKKKNIFKKCLNKSLNNYSSQIKKSTNGIYRHLTGIFKYFITTNADKHINNFFDYNNIHYKNMHSGPIKKDTLYKIHGCISDINSMVFTTDEYLRQYMIETNNTSAFKLGNFLQSVFMNYDVVFIGYGLAEFELLERMIGISSDRKHYIINGYYEHQIELIKVNALYFHSFNVQQVVYKLNNNGHAELTKYIEQYYNEKSIEINNPLSLSDEMDEALGAEYE